MWAYQILESVDDLDPEEDDEDPQAERLTELAQQLRESIASGG